MRIDQFVQTPPTTSLGNQYESFSKHIRVQPTPAAEQFWRAYLSNIDAPTRLSVATVATKQTQTAETTATACLTLSSDQTASLIEFAQTHQLTVNTLLQATWAFLLAAQTGQSTVTFGVTISGRPVDPDGVTHRAGLYSHTIPLTNTPDTHDSVLAWLTAIQQGHTQARQYQHTTMSQLQGWSGIGERLFDSVLVVRKPGIQIQQPTNVALTLIADIDRTLTITFQYKEQLIEPARINEIVTQFEQVLDQLLANGSDQPVSDLTALLPAQTAYLRRLGEMTSTAPCPRLYLDLFDERANRQPDQVAVVWQDQRVTFAELSRMSHQIAQRLVRLGVQPGQVVGLCLDRSPRLIAGILAAWRVGAAYSPIDPDYPVKRMIYMLDDADMMAVLCETSTYRPAFDRRGLGALNLDEPLADAESVGLSCPNQPADLAYILYTSGSTGRPKGARITHQALANYVQTASGYHSNEDSRQSGTYWTASIAFDMSVSILFPTLVMGKQLVIGSGSMLELFEDPAFLQFAPYDALTMTPTQFTVLDDFLAQHNDPWVADRYVLGGEPLLPTHFDRIKQKGVDVEIINIYGPTETTVACSTYRFRTQDTAEVKAGCVVVGRPSPNVNLYVLDPQARLALPGVAGELYVGGVQVGDGYQNNPELTRQRFITHPLLGRLYRTGDVVVWQESGQLGYLGRNDDQVKIRGHRIELGEVENVLRQAPGVTQGVIGVRQQNQRATGLVAYVAVTPNHRQSDTLTFLRSRLPAYMIPASLIEVDQIPQTPNGKADRKALALLDTAHRRLSA